MTSNLSHTSMMWIIQQSTISQTIPSNHKWLEIVWIFLLFPHKSSLFNEIDEIRNMLASVRRYVAKYCINLKRGIDIHVCYLHKIVILYTFLMVKKLKFFVTFIAQWKNEKCFFCAHDHQDAIRNWWKNVFFSLEVLSFLWVIHPILFFPWKKRTIYAVSSFSWS